MSRSDWKPMAERERQEWELADVILCGSEYVRNNVCCVGGPSQPCRVVPYGINQAKTAVKRRQPGRRLRILFVGTLCLRKGVPYLLEAARALRNRVEFRLVGPHRLTDSVMSRLTEWADVRGSVPRSEIEAHYGWADAFVLPTISEGSANVCYEALAAGLPVITTPNAGSIVRDEVDGYLVRIRDVGAIIERIEQLSQDRDLHGQMSQSALGRARTYTWVNYKERLLAAMEMPTAESSEIDRLIEPV